MGSNHLVPFPDIQLHIHTYSKIVESERSARIARDFQTAIDHHRDLPSAALCRPAGAERLEAIGMVYTPWQQRHFFRYLDSYDVLDIICENNTEALGDSRIPQLLSKHYLARPRFIPFVRLSHTLLRGDDSASADPYQDQSSQEAALRAAVGRRVAARLAGLPPMD